MAIKATGRNRFDPGDRLADRAGVLRDVRRRDGLGLRPHPWSIAVANFTCHRSGRLGPIAPAGITDDPGRLSRALAPGKFRYVRRKSPRQPVQKGHRGVPFLVGPKPPALYLSSVKQISASGRCTDYW
jgi:hypothetical protein